MQELHRLRSELKAAESKLEGKESLEASLREMRHELALRDAHIKELVGGLGSMMDVLEKKKERSLMRSKVLRS